MVGRVWLATAFLCSVVGEDWSRLMWTEGAYGNFSRPFTEQERLGLREQVRGMFTFGWDNYIRHAFPLDELDPIHCVGRGPDYENPENININDVLGDYCLTLVDSLDTLAVGGDPFIAVSILSGNRLEIMGNRSEFHRAVELAIEYVSFERDNVVQVFEVTIRVLGALLSAHMILTDPQRLLGDFAMPGYDGELLSMAEELAHRLTPAFHASPTGIPYPRVNLASGVPMGARKDTCLAGAGSLLLEFGALSRLVNDTTFEALARRANRALFSLRDPKTGLFGNTLDVESGEWVGAMSGVGAGLDSYYEYLLKAYVLFGDKEDFAMFNQTYARLKKHLRKGAGVELLSGDLDEAICTHALYYAIWRKYEALPERFNWQLLAPDVSFYPLRPELAETTYLLYLSTRNPFYLHVGREIIESIEKHTRVVCGYATMHDVHDKSLEDRMESFFLSETTKYLYLLYDFGNPVNRHYEKLLFTTEGHVFPIDARFRTQEPAEPLFPSSYSNPQPCSEDEDGFVEDDEEASNSDYLWERSEEITTVLKAWNSSSPQPHCDHWPRSRSHGLPLRPKYMAQLAVQLQLP